MPLVCVCNLSREPGRRTRASRCRGAIGLAMIDTVIYTRSAVHGVAIMDSLQAGDIGTAKFVGIPLDVF